MMTQAEFVKALKIQTSDSATDGITNMLTKPPGRQSSERLVKMSQRWLSLSASDRKYIQEIMQEAAESAIFGFLNILDGTRVIENDQGSGSFRLIYEKDGTPTLLNPINGRFLHDIYNRLCQQSKGLNG